MTLSKENENEKGAHFQTTFGLVLSCMGCVVGTGNIWRFPRIVANNSNEEGKNSMPLRFSPFVKSIFIHMIRKEYYTCNWKGGVIYLDGGVCVPFNEICTCTF